MKVNNILRTTAEYLDLKSVIKYLDGDIDINEEISGDINNLLIAINMVNNNVASSYIELIGEAEIDVRDKLLEFSAITNKSIIEIKNIESQNGTKVSFKIFPEGVKLEKFGMCKIEYTYFPDKVTIDDEINHYLKLNEITFSMGVAGEYLYIKGSLDDAYMWDKRFKSALFNLLRPKRNIVLPSKRW